MKKRFSEEQIIPILREAATNGNNLDLCRTYGISEQTFDYWRRRYQGVSVSELQRLKLLESEHAKLKRIASGGERGWRGPASVRAAGTRGPWRGCHGVRRDPTMSGPSA
jgi:putative transposase